VNHCGLVGLDRRPHRVGRIYRELALAAMQARYELLPVPGADMSLAAAA
jgi:hypothetical protein